MNSSFLPTYEFFFRNYEFFLRNYEFFLRDYEFFLRNCEFFLRNYEFFLPGPIESSRPGDPGMDAKGAVNPAVGPIQDQNPRILEAWRSWDNHNANGAGALAVGLMED